MQLVYYSDTLYHHGVKNQKWGVRRYQNADGSLTPAGRNRYGVKESKRYRDYNDWVGSTNYVIDPGGTMSKGKKRRQEKMRALAEKELGRKLKANDIPVGVKITKRGIKNIKRYDEQKREYSKVKKKSDPAYDWLRGYNVDKNISLNERDVKRIIKKLQKNPNADGTDLYEQEVKRKVGIRKATQILGVVGTVAYSTLAANMILRQMASKTV